MADWLDVRDGDIVLVHRLELYYARVERPGRGTSSSSRSTDGSSTDASG